MPVLKNMMEDAVMQLIDQNLDKKNTCNCQQCRMDIAALALNKLPTRYVVADQGAVYNEEDLRELQEYIDIVGAIKQSIKLVKEHPRH